MGLDPDSMDFAPEVPLNAPDRLEKAVAALPSHVPVLRRLSKEGLGTVAEIKNTWTYEEVYDATEYLDIEFEYQEKERRKQEMQSN